MLEAEEEEGEEGEEEAAAPGPEPHFAEAPPHAVTPLAIEKIDVPAPIRPGPEGLALPCRSLEETAGAGSPVLSLDAETVVTSPAGTDATPPTPSGQAEVTSILDADSIVTSGTAPLAAPSGIQASGSASEPSLDLNSTSTRTSEEFTRLDDTVARGDTWSGVGAEIDYPQMTAASFRRSPEMAQEELRSVDAERLALRSEIQDLRRSVSSSERRAHDAVEDEAVSRRRFVESEHSERARYAELLKTFKEHSAAGTHAEEGFTRRLAEANAGAKAEHDELYRRLTVAEESVAAHSAASVTAHEELTQRLTEADESARLERASLEERLAAAEKLAATHSSVGAEAQIELTQTLADLNSRSKAQHAELQQQLDASEKLAAAHAESEADAQSKLTKQFADYESLAKAKHTELQQRFDAEERLAMVSCKAEELSSAEMQQQLRNATNRSAGLLAKSNDKVSSLEAHVASLSATSAELREELRMREATGGEIEGAVLEADAARRAALERAAETGLQLEEANEKAEGALAKVVAFDDKCADVMRLEGEVAALKDASSKLRDEMHKGEAMRAEDQTTIANLQRQVADAELASSTAVTAAADADRRVADAVQRAEAAEGRAAEVRLLQAEVASLEATAQALRDELGKREAAEGDGDGVLAQAEASKQAALEAAAASERRAQDASEQAESATNAAMQQIQRLQSLNDDLEAEAGQKIAEMAAEVDSLERRLRDEKASAKAAADEADLALRDMSLKLADTKAAEKVLEKQVDELCGQVAAAQRKAKAEATREKEATIDEVREEMEKELAGMLKKKDEQVRSLEAKIGEQTKRLRDNARELERSQAEIESLRTAVAQQQSAGQGRAEDHQRTLDGLAEDHQRRTEELEQLRAVEERHKHELMLNLRSVEERSSSEVQRLEVEKNQLDLQVSALQVQLQEEQQKCADLSAALGEAAQRSVLLDDSSGGEDRAQAAEAEVFALRDRLRSVEEKLIDAQSVRDMFAKETEMYRGELKAARDERKQLEEDFSRAQERASREPAAGDASAAQHAVASAMQKDFEERTERYRDEVQYLRQKCDEKDRRCEQLLAERSSLSAQLRSGDAAAAESEAAASGISSGRALAQKPAKARFDRALPLSAPSWLRSADEPLRLIVRSLAGSPAARFVFFVYVILLHVWVLFVLQYAALTPVESVSEEGAPAEAGTLLETLVVAEATGASLNGTELEGVSASLPALRGAGK